MTEREIERLIEQRDAAQNAADDEIDRRSLLEAKVTALEKALSSAMWMLDRAEKALRKADNHLDAGCCGAEANKARAALAAVYAQVNN